MFLYDTPQRRRTLRLAIIASLILHGAALFLVPQLPPPPPLQASSKRPPTHLDARLSAKRAQVPSPASRPTPPPAPAPAPPPSVAAKPQPQKRILAMEKPKTPSVSQPTPKWSVAEKEEMNRFLNDLQSEAKAKPAPNLAERSLAMAREFGRQQERPGEDDVQIVERVPNSPPIDPFSLEMYFDALLKKLNRSADFVRRDPRSRGVKTASLVIRINPSGSLRTFQVVEAGDQQDEIDFIRAVVNQAVPFAAFPPDIVKSAQSLALVICIRPARAGEGGFGFVRMPNGRNC